MNILKKSNQHLLEMLGENYPHDDKKHRLIDFLIINDIDNGKAIFNTLTCSFIWMSNEEFNNVLKEDLHFNMLKYLWDNYFFVNDDFDEYEASENLKTWLRPNVEHESYLKPGNIKSFTILTTMACNARCFYCYEKGRPQTPMKADTARKVADYIINTAVKDGSTIKLSWFGGEPLVNENVIDIICTKVKNAGFNYYSTFTSNGLLFKPEKLEKYRNLWHLKLGQITIDGTEEVYNKTKNYKNVKGKNPYEIVLNNCYFLMDHGISISIRINVDNYNLEDVKKLIPELYWKLHLKSHKDMCNIYCYPIFEEGDYHRTDEENEKLYEGLKELDSILDSLDLRDIRRLPTDIKYSHCMVDSGESVLISTQGDIGLCEHYSDDNFWGHIDDIKKKDIDMIKSFQDYMPLTDLCKNCPIVPQCLRPKKCEDLKNCSIYIKDWHIRMFKEYVNNEYNLYKKSLEQKFINNNTCNCGEKCSCGEKCNCEETEKISLWKKILIKFGIK